MPIGIYPRTEKHFALLAKARKKIGVVWNKGLVGFKHSGSFKKGHLGYGKGIPRSKEVKEKISNANMGNQWKKGYKFSSNHPMRVTMKKMKSGEKCNFWKGGVAKVNDVIRHSMEYRLWRKAVFERDNYTCIWCFKRGGGLNADHIKPFCDYPELRFAIDNGRTLCVECHKKTDTYAKNKKAGINYGIIK